MKKILLILLICFTAIFSFAQSTQYPVPQNLGNANTLLNTNGGGIKAAHINLIFADTIAANAAAHFSFNDGTMLQTGDSLWLRYHNKWALIGANGGSSDSLYVLHPLQALSYDTLYLPRSSVDSSGYLHYNDFVKFLNKMDSTSQSGDTLKAWANGNVVSEFVVTSAAYNLATNDLTQALENRTYDGSGYNLTFNNINTLELSADTTRIPNLEYNDDTTEVAITTTAANGKIYKSHWLGGSSNFWSLTGNSGTDPSVNFIGTTDKDTLIFKVNNNLSGILDNVGGNVGFGGFSFDHNISGISNTALGYTALLGNESGNENTAIGTYSLINNLSGNSNTAIGYAAIVNAGSGFINNGNTAIGDSSLFLLQGDGSYNTAIGLKSNDQIFSGDYNTTIGYNSQSNSYGTAIGVNTIAYGINSTAVGAYATAGSDNSLILGSIAGINGATSSVNVGIGTTTPDSTLHIVGGLKLDLPSNCAGCVLTNVSGDGAATWQTPTGGSGTTKYTTNQYGINIDSATTNLYKIKVDTSTNVLNPATQGYVSRSLTTKQNLFALRPIDFGIVSSLSTDNATKFQVMFDSAKAKNMPVMIDSAYKVSTVTLNGITVFGTNTNSIIYTNSNSKQFRIVGSNTTITGLNFRADSAGTTQCAIFIDSSLSVTKYNINVNSIRITGYNTAISGEANGYNSNGCRFSNLLIDSCSKGIVTINRMEYNTFTNIYIIQCGIGVENAAGNNQFIGCEINGCSWGVYLHGGTNANHSTMSSTTINANTTYALYIDGANNSGTSEGYNFISCYISGTPAAPIYMNNSVGIRFKNCTFASQSSITYTSCNYIEFLNNTWLTTPTFTTTSSTNTLACGNYWYSGAPLGFSENCQVTGSGVNTSLTINDANNSNATVRPGLIFKNCGGTVPGAFTALASGAIIGDVQFQAPDGSAYQTKLSIEGNQSGSVSSGVVPMDLLIKTSATSSGRAETFRFTATGKLGIGTGSTVSAYLHTIGTTEQLRIGYDASNYQSLTIGSTGSATYQLTGTSPTFSFGKAVAVTGALSATTTITATTTVKGTTGVLAGTAKWSSGTGTPEGAVTGNVGDIFSRTDGGAGTTFYVKESGTGNTGWIAK